VPLPTLTEARVALNYPSPIHLLNPDDPGRTFCKRTPPPAGIMGSVTNIRIRNGSYCQSCYSSAWGYAQLSNQLSLVATPD
jgi:hypothetical protein